MLPGSPISMHVHLTLEKEVCMFTLQILLYGCGALLIWVKLMKYETHSHILPFICGGYYRYILTSLRCSRTKPLYSPSANQRPEACSGPPRVTRVFKNSLYLIGRLHYDVKRTKIPGSCSKVRAK